jgi:hypothetical protein
MGANITEPLKSAIAGGIIGCLMCALMNHFVVPFPHSVIANTINNGIGGLVTGLIAGFMGVFIYMRKQQKE